MNELATIWWGWILPAAIQATLILLLVALIDRLLPTRLWPQVRTVLWWAVLLRLALPPLVALPWALEFPGAPAAGIAPGWTRWVAIAWLCGVVVTLVSIVTRHRLALRRLRRQTVVDRGDDEALQRIAAMTGVRRLPEIRCGDSVATPFVIGVWRPTIFLPSEMTEGEREFALVHELTHVRRRDLVWATVALAFAVVYWFHPAVWWLGRRLNELREQSCDQRVAEMLGDRTSDYRQALIGWTRRWLQTTERSAHGMLGPAGLLRARLQILDRPPQPQPFRRRLALAIAMSIAIVIALPVAGGAERQVASVAEWIDRPPGCFELRLLTMKKLAEQENSQ